MKEQLTSMLIHGLSQDELKRFKDDAFDSCVTDPPYELNFMGKEWDRSGISYDVEFWKEVFRVLKPGAHLIAFGGSRTYHRIAVAIEDAGFEIRDQLQWIYGSGFPKNLNVGKSVDKIQGNERTSTGIIKHHAQKGVAIAETRGEVGGGSFGTAKDEEITVGNSEYEGWGTALKPAHEPIVLARKPLSERSVAANMLKHGTGGINIDACRIPLKGEKQPSGSAKIWLKNNAFTDDKKYGTEKVTPLSGRYPANIILDEEAGRILDNQAPQAGAFAPVSSGQKDKTKGIYGKFLTNGDDGRSFHDGIRSGASRFFYCPKASRKERDFGLNAFNYKPPNYGANMSSSDKGSLSASKKHLKNDHPTVKPIALMAYLCRLITPTAGMILDPFAGSGTTGCAAVKEGFGFVGIDKESHNCDIARARISGFREMAEKEEKVLLQTLPFEDCIDKPDI